MRSTRQTVANVDLETVEGFGAEWTVFDHRGGASSELERMFESYFRICPWDDLPAGATGFDLGCGSGRWARFVAPRVGRLVCIDASAAALAVARRNLAGFENCEFSCASVGGLPLAAASADFGFSLGVLHHVPDTAAALRSCAKVLRPGAPFLVYLYYAFDNRPAWYRMLWRASDLVRRLICRLPFIARYAVTQIVAAMVYWPLARFGLMLERTGCRVAHLPLAAYRSASFYTMRNDALDRFGTRLERRFSAREIKGMLENAGFERVRFSDSPPYWCVVAYRQSAGVA